MSSTFLAACDQRRADTVQPDKEPLSAFAFREVGGIIIAHLSLFDIARVALCIDHTLSNAARAHVVSVWPKFRPLLGAPFHLSRHDLLHMEKLVLNFKWIGDAGIQTLASACASGAMAQCQELDLSDNEIGSAGVEAFASACASGAMAHLLKLYLYNNNIGDAGVSALADVCASGAMASLRELYLGANQIGDAGVEALAKAVAGGALAHLQVSSLPTALKLRMLVLLV